MKNKIIKTLLVTTVMAIIASTGVAINSNEEINQVDAATKNISKKATSVYTKKNIVMYQDVTLKRAVKGELSKNTFVTGKVMTNKRGQVAFKIKKGRYVAATTTSLGVTKIKARDYYVSNPGNVAVKAAQKTYANTNLTKYKKTVSAKSYLKVKGIVWNTKGKPVLKTDAGYLLIKKNKLLPVAKNLSGYLTKQPERVILVRNTQGLKQGAIYPVTNFNWVSGYPEVTVSGGTKIRAARSTVVQPRENIGSYYTTQLPKVVVVKNTTVYKDVDLKNSVGTKNTGAIVTVNKLTYTTAGTPCFQLSDGTYMTTNKNNSRPVAADLSDYYTTNPGQVQASTTLTVYSAPNFGSAKEVKTIAENQVINIQGIEWDADNHPVFVVDGGYITAAKNNVNKVISIASFYPTVTTQTKFIVQYAEAARTVAKSYGLYGSIQMAQASLESGWGSSELTKQALNFFGVKGSYNGESVTMRTAEYNSNGQLYYVDAAFKKYPNAAASFVDNALVIRNGPSWNHNYYAAAWRENAPTYQDATAALTGHYATDPNYGTKLNTLIATYQLNVLCD
ncbi:DUF5776 domain-containing protein [Periweissella cryptocerci]|nr:DUF5776 domain-containing protein [Periweissella cryptocerci]